MKLHFLSKTLLLTSVLLLVVSINPPGLRAESSGYAQANEPFELGGQILTFLHPGEMQSAGMTWLKMQITWQRGGSTADAQNVIGHARRNGFKVLLSIKGLKTELAANPSQYYQDFATFLGAAAALSPDAIEVWNEPNIDQEWPVGLISGTAYTQMLSHAYPAIKQTNANVMVISGAPAPTGYFGGRCTANGCDDNVFIQQMAAAQATRYFDCTGIHYNEGVLPPTATSGDPRGNPNHYTRYYLTMVNLYRSVFPTKPLCFTELGYLSPEGLGTLPAGFEWAANTSAQEQAQWLAQAATLSRDGGVVRLMVVWNVDASFTPGNPMAGYAIIRTNGQCLACQTLAAALSKGPKLAPGLMSPADGSLLNYGTPQFSWSGVTDASGYRIQIDNHSTFASPEWIQDQAGMSYTPNPALPDGTYYWRVRGQNNEGSGPWSQVRRLTVDTQPPPVPTITAPQNGAVISTNPPPLSWGAAVGASRYELRLGVSNPPSTVAFSGNATSYRPSAALIVGAYFWQVRAIDAASNASAWSMVNRFNLVSPNTAAPDRNYYTTNQVSLRWSRMTWAVAYQIEVDVSPSFNSAQKYVASISSSRSDITTPTLANGTYYWRVRAQRGDGSWSGWSAVDNFRVAVAQP